MADKMDQAGDVLATRIHWLEQEIQRAEANGDTARVDRLTIQKARAEAQLEDTEQELDELDAEDPSAPAHDH